MPIAVARRAAVGAGLAVAGGVAVLGAQAHVASSRARDRLVRPEFEQRAIAGVEHVGEPLRVALVGDSTVAGIGVRSSDAWLGPQVAQQVSRSTGRPVEVVGFGVSGARTGQVLSAQVHHVAAQAGRWDAVVAVVGGNDVTHLTPYRGLARDTTALTRALHDASAGAPVVYAGVPRFFDAIGIPRPLRDVFDASSRRVATLQRAAVEDARVGARFVDIGVESSVRHAGRLDSLSPDGFHPSRIGYGFWADAIAPRVAAAVARG